MSYGKSHKGNRKNKEALKLAAEDTLRRITAAPALEAIAGTVSYLPTRAVAAKVGHPAQQTIVSAVHHTDPRSQRAPSPSFPLLGWGWSGGP